MPISDDGLDERNQESTIEPTSTMSKAELRKTHKPIMEKRRRARINHCLNEIKTLILEAMKKDPARHSKLEKADILEMAVKHLQNVQRQQLAMAIAGDPGVLRKFKTGFDECAREVSVFIGRIDEGRYQTAAGLSDRVAAHLTRCIGGIEQIARFNLSGAYPFAASNAAGTVTDDPSNGPRTGHETSSSSAGIRLIPSRLPTGELAFLIPNSLTADLSSLLGGEARADFESDKQKGGSAFVTVTPSNNNLSVNNQHYHHHHRRQDETVPIPTISPPPSPARDVVASEARTCSPAAKSFRPPLNSSALRRSYRSAFLSTAKLFRDHVEDSKRCSQQMLTVHNDDDDAAADERIAEPLCVITNRSERFKRARAPEDTVDCEENLPSTKRERRENTSETEICSYYGLLTVATNNQGASQSAANPEISNETYLARRTKLRPPYDFTADESNGNVIEKQADNQQTSSKALGRQHRDDNSESSMDMWRPW
ncbi:hypothetical protein Trydic_g19559 [Trypoxylus dichotomus]